jgi:dipeptidyl-peptidase-4
MYPKIVPIHYPKAGDKNASVRIGVVSVAGAVAAGAAGAGAAGATLWLRVPGDPRDDYVADMDFHQSGKVVMQQLNRLQNTVRVLIADPATGAVACAFEDRDDAWIDIQHELRWLCKGSKFCILSDRNGWRQIGLVSMDVGAGTSQVDMLTPLGTDVVELVGIDEAAGCAYYTASPADPLRRYLYRVGFDGTGNERVTPEGVGTTGTNSYTLSRDGCFAVHCYSSQMRPPVYSIVSLPGHAVCMALASNGRLLDVFKEVQCPPIEFFQVDVGVDAASGSSGVLDGYILKPPSMSEAAAPGSYPVLFHVYGEPAAQIARDQWGGRLGLWHRMLAQRGCVVVCIDNRGTPAPRGRAFRKSIYRQIGILAAADQAAAARLVLADRPYLDPARVGIWGWSGGGSMTLNLMFKSPDVYTVGVSVAPVPDMKCYDTIYQVRPYVYCLCLLLPLPLPLPLMLPLMLILLLILLLILMLILPLLCR